MTMPTPLALPPLDLSGGIAIPEPADLLDAARYRARCGTADDMDQDLIRRADAAGSQEAAQ